MNALYFFLGAWAGAAGVCILFIRGANPPKQGRIEQLEVQS
jgi:hypothetical protein